MIALLRRNPAFARLWLAQLVSQAGDWLNHMAILALIARLAGSGERGAAGLLFALDLVLRFLPQAALSTAAGSAADRLPRRALMITADLARAIVVLGLLTVDQADELPRLYFLLLLQMGLGTFFNAARAGAVPDTVRAEDLQSAYALSAATWSAMLALGGALGGILLVGIGVGGVFVVDALTYVVSAVLLARLSLPAVTRQPESFRLRDALLFRELGRAWEHAGERKARFAITAKWVWGPCGGFLVLLPLLGSQRFAEGLGAGRATAWLYAARGLGTGLGPLLAQRLVGEDDEALAKSARVGFLIAALGYALVPLAGGFWGTAALVVFAHMGGAALWISSTTLWQRRVAGGFRGRTFALEFGGLALSFSAWALAIGAGVDAGLGLDRALLICALAAAAGGLVWGRRSLRLVRSEGGS